MTPRRMIVTALALTATAVWGGMALSDATESASATSIAQASDAVSANVQLQGLVSAASNGEYVPNVSFATVMASAH